MRIDASALCSALMACALIFHPSAQFQTALPGYRYEFPRDYFDHPDYQTEWWYYTGNVQTSDGRKFGFELTFFRQGVNRAAKHSPGWEVRDIYFAHFALSDLHGKRFFHTERSNRAGPGLAGASALEKKVWNGNWRVEWVNNQEHLTAIAESHTLALSLTSQKPPVIHGRNGISQKAAEAGRASHYFSETRLMASGTLTFAGQTYSVSGLTWMDHEFFTHQLESNQAGWDWFSLQLNDDTELMLFQIRRRDGTVDPYSAGTFVSQSGLLNHIEYGRFELKAGSEVWTSQNTGARYPLHWQIRIPGLALFLDITTPLPSQELVATSGVTPSYWEGAVLLQGKKNSVEVTGSGYLEMTGYDRPVQMGELNFAPLDRSSALDHPDQHDRDRQQEQNVDVTTQSVGRNHP